MTAHRRYAFDYAERAAIDRQDFLAAFALASSVQLDLEEAISFARDLAHEIQARRSAADARRRRAADQFNAELDATQHQDQAAADHGAAAESAPQTAQAAPAEADRGSPASG